MRNKKNKSSKLVVYIIISLVFHLVFFYIFPLGNLAGVAGGEETEEDFGYIQVVEYQPPTQTTDAEGDAEERETGQEEKDEVESEETNEDEKQEEDIEKEEEIEEEEGADEQETETETENNETSEEEKAENETEGEQTDNGEQNETNGEEEVLSSEESDTEVNVEDDDEQAENEKSSDEGDNGAEEEDDSSDEDEEEAPPPPPTSGELISASPSPAYPKDLIGESITGTVVLKADVSSSGEIKEVQITKESEVEQINRTARLTIERGWQFRSYNQGYSIPITVKFEIDDAGNPDIEVELGEVSFEEVSE